jgi:hypothetical protein
MKVKTIRHLINNGNNDITIIHSDGAFHYNEKDVTLIEWTNNFFCRFNIDHQSNWQRFIFWNWVLSISVGLFFLLIGTELSEIPMMKRKDGFSEIILIGMNNFLYLLPLFISTYITFRWIYFLRYRDFFSKNLIHISLKSNQSITLRQESFHFYREIDKILPKEKRIFETERKKDNLVKMVSEYLFAIIIFSVCFYSIHSNWGKNSISDPFPIPHELLKEELSEKVLAKLTSRQEDDYYQKRLKQLNEFSESWAKWEEKYKNEQIPPYFFISLGYVLPLIIGVAIFVCLLLFVLIIILLGYINFWLIGYSYNRFKSRRELNKVLKKKYIYPVVSLLFILSVFTHLVFTQDVISTLVLFLIPIAAPIFASLLLGAVIGSDGGLIKEFFSIRYWKFLFTGKAEFISENSFLNIAPMIAIPWLLVFYHSFNYGNPETVIQKVVLVICIIVVIVRLLFRALSPFAINLFFSINLSNIKNGRYLSFFKYDFLSIRTLVKENGSNLEFASNRLKDNMDIVKSAIENNGLSLQFISEELRNDKEIVLMAINQNPKAIEFASIGLQNDTDIIELLNKN